MRITTSKSKNSESFYITQSYTNANGKSTSKTIRKLGTLAELSAQLHTDRDGVVEWANEQARLETLKYKSEKELILPDLFCKTVLFYTTKYTHQFNTSAHIYYFNYNTLTTTVSHSFYYLTLAFTYSAHGPNTFSLLSAVRFHLRRLK